MLPCHFGAGFRKTSIRTKKSYQEFLVGDSCMDRANSKLRNAQLSNDEQSSFKKILQCFDYFQLLCSKPIGFFNQTMVTYHINSKVLCSIEMSVQSSTQDYNRNAIVKIMNLMTIDNILQRFFPFTRSALIKRAALRCIFRFATRRRLLDNLILLLCALFLLLHHLERWS